MTTWLECRPSSEEQSVPDQIQVLAAASHDLRQPLHALSLYLGELSGLDLPERARRAIHDASQCARAMDDMLGSVLDISRLHARQDTPRMTVFCISAVLARVARTFAPLAHSRGVRLKVRARKQLVCSDLIMVERIAMNFISNAVRHAPGGRVLVACRMRGDTLRLAVHDNGPGIPLAMQRAIFNEFYRLDTVSHPGRSGGFGLGLAIVRQLAQALQAPVTVRSRPGHGAMFAVDLPALRACTAPPDAAPGAPGIGGLAGKLVVLIDSDAPALLTATTALQSAGCVVVSAISERQALDVLVNISRAPDAIVCRTAALSGTTGSALIQDLREEFNCDIPALLRKSFDPAAMLNALESLLNTKET